MESGEIHTVHKVEDELEKAVCKISTEVLASTSWIQRECTLTHRGRVTYICVGKLTIIGSDNGLSPGRRQAIIWTNAGILFIEPLGTNVSEILIGIKIFSFKKMHLKMSSANWRPFCLGLNMLKGSEELTVATANRHSQQKGPWWSEWHFRFPTCEWCYKVCSR